MTRSIESIRCAGKNPHALKLNKDGSLMTTARIVNIRARVGRQPVGPVSVLVLPSGEMHVWTYSPHDGFHFTPGRRVGLTDAAKRRAWKASGFRVGGVE